MNWQNKWKEEMKENGFKYFILKAEDLFDCLDENWLHGFNEILKKYNSYRRLLKAKSVNKYFVVNRDEPYADEIKNIIEKNEGVIL